MTTCIEAPVGLPIDDEPAGFRPCEFRISWAATAWQREQAHALRRAVFCVEQGIFLGDDRDAIDDHAQLLVAQACVGGMPDEMLATWVPLGERAIDAFCAELPGGAAAAAQAKAATRAFRTDIGCSL